MVTMLDDPPPAVDYPSLFHDYIRRSLRYVLNRVQQCQVGLPVEEQHLALHILSFGLKDSDLWPEARELLLTVAPKMEQASHRDKWMSYLEQGINLSRRLADQPAEAELYYRLGILYELRSKYDQAGDLFERSAILFEALADSFNQARALNYLAQVARRKRQFERTTALAEKALYLFDPDEPERAFSYLILGLVALDRRSWEAAIDLFRQSLAIWEQADNRRMMAWCLTNLGAALQSQKNFQAAIDSYQTAITLFEETGDLLYLAGTQVNLGNVYLSLEQPLDGLELFAQAEKIFRLAQDQLRLAQVTHNMGIAYRQLQQWEEAVNAYLSSIRQHLEIDNIVSAINVLDGLGLVYIAQGQTLKAEATFKEAMDLLAQVKDKPNHDFFFEMISTHLEHARNRRGSTL